jgi:hypothetical protein
LRFTGEKSERFPGRHGPCQAIFAGFVIHPICRTRLGWCDFPLESGHENALALLGNPEISCVQRKIIDGISDTTAGGNETLEQQSAGRMKDARYIFEYETRWLRASQDSNIFIKEPAPRIAVGIMDSASLCGFLFFPRPIAEAALGALHLTAACVDARRSPVPRLGERLARRPTDQKSDLTALHLCLLQQSRSRYFGDVCPQYRSLSELRISAQRLAAIRVDLNRRRSSAPCKMRTYIETPCTCE